MILRSRQRCSHQVVALLSIAVGGMMTGCQSTDGVVWRTNLQQPVPVSQQQDEPAVCQVSPESAVRQAIRPGHSFDIDTDAQANATEQADVRLVGALRESSDADAVEGAAFGHQSLPGYPIPPPPTPLEDAPGSVRDANSASESHAGSALPIGFGFLRRTGTGGNRDLTTGDRSARDVMVRSTSAGPSADDAPKSPKLASPFSLRRLYETFRPRKGETDESAADERASETSTRVCEYNELNPATPDGVASPVSLGLPETDIGSDPSQAGQRRSAVTQTCPSNFHHPLCADSNDIEKYTRE